MELILAILLGGFFGIALSYVGATKYKNILKMLRLEDLSLAKIILFAIGFSSVLLSLASMFGLFDLSHLHVKTMNLGVIIGGLIFGIAFGSVGTCPGTCVGAIGGDNFKKALSGILGGVLGAFTFTEVYKYLVDLNIFESLNLGKITLFNVSDGYPSVFNIGFTGLLFVGILFMIVAYILPQQIIKE